MDDAEREQGEETEATEPDAPSEPEQADPAPAEEVPASEAAAEAPGSDEPTADDEQPTADVPAAAESPDAEAPSEQPAAEEKAAPEKRDVVPGADLEPIAITEERELTAEERARKEAEDEERAAREAAAAGDEDDDAVTQRTVTVPGDTNIQATGKRKSAVARVIVRPGSGAVQVNSLPIEDYFARPRHQSVARQPLVTSGYEGSVDVKVRVHGGGISGQAGAVRHGIARALTNLEPELRGDLKRRGMLTRDDRRKERKKAGLKKARKRPQFSKR